MKADNRGTLLQMDLTTAVLTFYYWHWHSKGNIKPSRQDCIIETELMNMNKIECAPNPKYFVQFTH